MLYDFDPRKGVVRFERDETCSYLCLEHARDNEDRARAQRGIHGFVNYPHTNRRGDRGLSLYLDLRPTDVA